jgi:hypothetical protein
MGLWSKIKKHLGLDFLADLFTSVFGAIGDVLAKTLFHFAWKTVEKYLGEVFSWIGIETKSVFIAKVAVSKVFDDDYLQIMKTKQALKFNKNGISALEYYLGFTNTGNNQYTLYYNEGKRYSKSFTGRQVPSVTLRYKKADNDAVEKILKNIYGSDIIIDSITFSPLNASLYTEKYLADNTNYNTSSKTLSKDGIYYSYDYTQLEVDADANLVATLVPFSGTVTVTTTTNKFYDDYDSTATTTTQHVNKSTVTTLSRSDGTYVASSTTYDNTSYTVNVSDAVNTTETVTETKDQSYSGDSLVYHIPYDNIDTDATYCVATFYLNNEKEIWIYDIDSNKYPELTDAMSIYENYTPLPVAILRNNKINITSYNAVDALNSFIDDKGLSTSKNTITDGTAYKKTKALLAKMELDLDEFMDQVVNSGSDLSDVTSAFFIVGIDLLNVKSQPVAKLLYHKFETLYDESLIANSDTLDMDSYCSMVFQQMPYQCVLNWFPKEITITEGKLTDPDNSSKYLGIGQCRHTYAKYDVNEVQYYHYIITHNKVYYSGNKYYIDGYYKTSYEENIITKASDDTLIKRTILSVTKQYYSKSYYDGTEWVDREIPDEGTYVETMYHVKTVDDDGNESSDWVRAQKDGGAPNHFSDEEHLDKYRVYTYSIEDYELQKQITSNTYKTIVLQALNFFYVVNEDQKSGCVAIEMTSANAALATSTSSADQEKENIHAIIPITYGDLQCLSLMEKTDLFGDVTYLVLFAEKWEHIKWYQTSAFKIVMRIVQIVLVIVVFIFTWYLGPGPAAGVAVFFETLFEFVVIAVGVYLCLKFIQKHVHNAILKGILTAVVLVVAFYYGGGFDNLNNVLTCVELATIAIESFNTTVSSILTEKVNALNSSITSFQEEYESRLDAVDEINDSFNSWTAVDMVSLTHANNQANYSTGSEIVYFPSFDEQTYLLYNGAKLYDLLYDLPDRCTDVENFSSINFNNNNDVDYD